MLKQFIPDSLFGRLITALLAAILVSTLAVALLIAREWRDLAFWRSDAVEAVNTITKLSRELAAMPSDERETALERLREQRFRHVIRRPAGEEGGAPAFHAASGRHEAVARTIQARLKREADGRYLITVTPARLDRQDVVFLAPETSGAQQLAVFDGSVGAGRSVEAGGRRVGIGGGTGRVLHLMLDAQVQLPDGESVTFRTFAPSPPPRPPPQIFLQLGALTLLLGAALFVMARTITRPLSELASAADAMGRGLRVTPLREGGARELREATRAFNAMQERLHRYLDSRTRVLAAMSHDLRTPLTRLRLRAETISDPRVQEKIGADLDEMDQMVRNALDLFRGLNEDETPVELDINALLAQLKSEFAELGPEVEIEGRAERPIRLRPVSIKRCLTNLLTNAVKFGGRATVRVEDGEALVIRVRDEGPGIPAESLEQVFEPFFRLEGSRNVDTGGAGLGLSIARDIAQAHRGSIALRNLSPRGLEATLTLPRSLPSRTDRR